MEKNKKISKMNQDSAALEDLKKLHNKCTKEKFSIIMEKNK